MAPPSRIGTIWSRRVASRIRPWLSHSRQSCQPGEARRAARRRCQGRPYPRAWLEPWASGRNRAFGSLGRCGGILAKFCVLGVMDRPPPFEPPPVDCHPSGWFQVGPWRCLGRAGGGWSVQVNLRGQGRQDLPQLAEGCPREMGINQVVHLLGELVAPDPFPEPAEGLPDRVPHIFRDLRGGNPFEDFSDFQGRFLLGPFGARARS